MLERASALEQNDPVGRGGKLGSMCDEKHGPPDTQVLDRGSDDGDTLRVEVGGRLVQDQQRGVAQKCAGEASRRT